MLRAYCGVFIGLLVLLEAGAAMAAGAVTMCDKNCLLNRAQALQPAKLFSAFPEMNGKLLTSQWAADGKALWFTAPSASGVVLYWVDVQTLSRKKLLAAHELATAIGKQQKVAVDPLAIQFRANAYSYETSIIDFFHAGIAYSYKLTTRQLSRRQVPLVEQPESVSPDGRYGVFTQDHDLYLRIGKAVKRLTDDGSQWHSFAAHMATSNPQDRVLAKQKSVAPLVRWIGSGPRFYIERWDNRNVGDMWQVDVTASDRPALVTQKYAYAGEDNLPVPELWIFDAEKASGFKVDTAGWVHIGNMDINNGGIFPARNANSLYFARMSRGYRTVELCKVDLQTGVVRVLLREHYPQSSGVRSVEFYELEQGFIWKSDREGFHHYYLYQSDGKLVRQLTRGSYSVKNIAHVDEANHRLLYTAYGDASVENPYYTYTHSVDLKQSVDVRLDTVPASHRISVSPTGRHYVDRYSRTDLPPKLVLKNDQGKPLMELASIDTSNFAKLGWQPPTRFEIKADDQKTSLFGMMWLPEDFDPKVRLPVITHVYPGPQGETPPFGYFSPHHPNAALAQLGFVVVAAGHRGGASNRGKAYQQFAMNSGNMRDYPLHDNKYVLEKLAETYPFIDLTRVGIYGHSGGGFMSVAAMLNYPDFYKVGVSGAGNHDNNIYEMNSGEFYFGHPVTGPAGGRAGYATTAALANRLKGRLLLIHGDMDQDVHIAHTLKLLRAFVVAGKKVDLVLLPGEGHHDFSSSSATYYRLRLWDYFLEHLAGYRSVSVDLGEQ